MSAPNEAYLVQELTRTKTTPTYVPDGLDQLPNEAYMAVALAYIAADPFNASYIKYCPSDQQPLAKTTNTSQMIARHKALLSALVRLDREPLRQTHPNINLSDLQRRFITDHVFRKRDNLEEETSRLVSAVELGMCRELSSSSSIYLTWALVRSATRTPRPALTSSDARSDTLKKRVCCFSVPFLQADHPNRFISLRFSKGTITNASSQRRSAPIAITRQNCGMNSLGMLRTTTRGSSRLFRLRTEYHILSVCKCVISPRRSSICSQVARALLF